MTKFVKVACFAVIGAALLSGCAFQAQNVRLQPQVQYVDSNDGHGLPVAIVVQDQRPTQDLGHRGNGQISAATITTNSDVPAVLKQAIGQGLVHRGFKIVGPTDAPHAVLTVQLRALKTELHAGFWTGHQEANGAAAATATNGTRTYENFYRVDSKQSKFWVPTAGQNSQYINAALSNLVGKIVNDDKLISFLSSP
jgi:uncharacterized lipoprotein YajG